MLFKRPFPFLCRIVVLVRAGVSLENGFLDSISILLKGERLGFFHEPLRSRGGVESDYLLTK